MTSRAEHGSLSAGAAVDLLSLGLIHDLRGPLSAASSAFRLLDERLAELSGEEKEVWRLGRMSLARAHAVMESWQRLVAAPAGAEPPAAHVGSIVRAVSAELAAELASRGVRLQIPARLPVIRCHPDRLRAIFRNLIANAARHLTGSTRPTIKIACRSVARGYRFAVRDNGPGLPLDLARRAFEPFARGPEPPGAPGGLGIGLTLVHWLVAEEGGEAWVRSRPGRGTTVSFFLPTCRMSTAEAAAAKRGETAGRPPRARSKRSGRAVAAPTERLRQRSPRP